MVKSPDENDEFEKQRTAAIAEVAKTKEVCNPYHGSVSSCHLMEMVVVNKDYLIFYVVFCNCVS